MNDTEVLRKKLDDHSAAMRDALVEARSLRQAIRVARAAGDEQLYATYVDRLRSLLRSHPTAWRLTGDLGRLSASRLVRLIASDDPDVRESVLAGLDDVRDSLDYGSSTTLEKLLADQVALNWLNCEVTRVIYAGLAFRGGEQPEHGRYWEARLSSVELRLQRAVESLARTRKLVRSTKKVSAAYESDQRHLAEKHAETHPSENDSSVAHTACVITDEEAAYDARYAAELEAEVGPDVEGSYDDTDDLDGRSLFIMRAKERGMTQEQIDMYLSLLVPSPASAAS